MSVSQSWWSDTYPKYSLSNYREMPVFTHFSSCTGPFHTGEAVAQSSFWTVDNCDIYEWFNQGSQEGEKLGHDKNSDTWFYEH